jgi:tetratricopeptide (TPR) repeat protein
MYQALNTGMEVLAVRDSVISAGINDPYPEGLYAADLVALDGVAQYVAEDYSAANSTAAKSLGIYQTLNTGMDVYNVRQEIVDRNFADYDSYNFDRADDISLAAIDSYEAGNIKEALDGAEEAKPLYNRVLSTGWAGATGKERQNALDVKANIAARNEFDSAEKLYSQAEAARKAEKYEEAAGLYNQSASRFISLAQTVTEKRRIATEAIKAAEEKIAESEEKAQDATLILEGGV